MIRPRRFVVACAVGLMSCSSSGWRQTAEVIGFTDPANPTPVTAAVLIDGSSRAGSPERVSAVVSWALITVSERPGSVLRLFALGNDLGSTELLAQVTSTPPP